MTATVTRPPENDRSSPEKSHDSARRLFCRVAVESISGLVPANEARELVAGLLIGRVSTAEVFARLNKGNPAGAVYFLQMQVPGRRGPIKVGSSNLPVRRCWEIGCASPYPITLLASYSGDILPEFVVHHVFRRTRMRGEWFRPTPRLLRFAEFVHRLSTIEGGS